jgi:hypothetical protein
MYPAGSSAGPAPRNLSRRSRVQWWIMQRSFLACLLGSAVLALVAPALASASAVELGSTSTALVAPTCPKGVAPANCTIILTRATALETVRDGVNYPTTVKTAGRIVAFTVGLSRLDSNAATAKTDIHFLDSSYGGTTRVAIAVLRPVGARLLRRWQLVAQSPVYHVQPYLGQVVRFPLATSLAVAPGDTVALTTPTWAPVLSIDLSTKKFAYRQSRATGCNAPPSTNQAQQTVGQSTRYVCDYPGTRVEYSATELTTAYPTSSTLVVPPVCSTAAPVTKCPTILARTTALETIAQGATYPSTVTASGRLVAFTVGLSPLASSRATQSSDIRALNRAFGGPPEAQITVLKRVGARSLRRWAVAAEGPLLPLAPYLGATAQLTLTSSLPVSAGETVALTTPTWAPILWSDASTSRFAYRQSRSTGCSSPPVKSAAQVAIRQSARYLCNYTGTGVAYGTTVLPTPIPPKNYIR